MRILPEVGQAAAMLCQAVPSLVSLRAVSLPINFGPWVKKGFPCFFLGPCQTWFISGEALHPDLALLFRRRSAPGAQLVNLYGSTEVFVLLFFALTPTVTFQRHQNMHVESYY